MNILFFLKPKQQVIYIYDDYTIRQANSRMNKTPGFQKYTTPTATSANFFPIFGQDRLHLSITIKQTCCSCFRFALSLRHNHFY